MLHIANIIKDQKFFDAQINYHDMTSQICHHDYFIVSWEKNIVFKYISKKDRIKIVNPDELISVLSATSYDAIFIHNFLYMPLHYMWKLPSNLKVFWFSWGYDIYNTPQSNPYVALPLLHMKSKELYQDIQKCKKRIPAFTKFKRAIKRKFKTAFHYKKLNHNDESCVYRRAVERVDFYSGVFPEEYDLLKKNPEFHAKRVNYVYSDPNDWIASTDFNFTNGQNILVGNSADINNNHIDVLDYLKKIDTTSRKIIVPLSYGGSDLYVNKVCDAYSQTLGQACVLLKDFMSRDDYFKLLSSVGIAIFFQERQQAVGNIEEMLRNGVKIFFSESSINYKHYKSNGFFVFSLQKDFNIENISTPLTKEQKIHNAMLLQKTVNKEICLQYLYDIYDILKK